MKTLRELFDEWREANPHHLQKTLLKSLSGTCRQFHNLNTLPYSAISVEMFQALIQKQSNQKQDDMRQLILLLDQYCSEHYPTENLHPELTAEKAVWMALHEPSTFQSETLTTLIDAKNDDSFQTLAAKHLLKLHRRQRSERTIIHHQRAIAEFSAYLEYPLHQIPKEEIARITQSVPQWLSPFCTSVIYEVNSIYNIEYFAQVTEAEVPLHGVELPPSPTLQDIYDIWFVHCTQDFSDNSMNTFHIAWNILTPLWSKEFRTIKIIDVQTLIDSVTPTSGEAVKRLYKKLEHLANGLDVIDRERSDFLEVQQHYAERRTALSQEDCDRLKPHIGEWNVDVTLVLKYTGLRAGELANLKKQQVDLTAQELRAGNKSRWAVNRVIPIHPIILPIIERWMQDDSSEYLIHKPRCSRCSNRSIESAVKMATAAYCSHTHIPHECRHAFYTELQRNEANTATCVASLTGHTPSHVGERVYSHPTPEQRYAAIHSMR